MGRSLDFTDFALSSSLEANPSLQLMEKISASINWSRVEAGGGPQKLDNVLSYKSDADE